MVKVSFYTLLAVLFVSCGFLKNSNSLGTNQEIYLLVSKTGCFGECPIYSLSLKDKSYNLEGYKFFEYLGKFRADLSETEVDEIIDLTEPMAWDKYKTEYKTGYSDLPSTIVQYSKSVGDTITICYENNLAPKEIVNLVKYMDAKIDSKDWTKVSTTQ